MALAKILVSIGADISELEKGLSKVSRSVQDTGKKMTSMGKTISTRVTAPLTLLAGVAVKAFGEQERAELRLRAALNANGRAVESLFSEYTTFASEMQKVTVIGDEASIAMLAQAEALGLTGESAMRAVKNSIAMQSAFGVNAQSALRYTAALEQGNSTMLARYIPALRDLEDESERVAEAQRILGNAFSAAESDANGVIGSFQQLKNALGDAMEDVGESIAEAFNITESRDRMIEQIQQVRDWFASLSKEARKNMVMIGAAIAAIGPTIVALGITITGLGVIIGALTSPVTLVVGAIAGLVTAIIYMRDNWQAVTERISDISWWRNAIIDMAQFLIKYSPISLMIDQFNNLLSYFGRQEIPNPFDSISSALEGLKTETKEYEHEFGSLKDAFLNTFEEFTGIDLGGMFTPVTQGAQQATQAVKNLDFSSLNYLETLESQRQAFANFKPVAKEATDQISNGIAFANQIANDFTNSFGAGMANVVVQGERLIDTLKNIGKLLASAVIQKGLSVLLTGGLGGSGLFGSGGGLFGRIFGVNDALITSGGDVVKFHPSDNLLAMKDFSQLGGGVQQVEVFGEIKNDAIWISSNRGSKTYGR